MLRFFSIFCIVFGTLYAQETREINFGILSLASPSKIYTSWKPFSAYLEKESGVKVHIVAPRGFKKLKKMAERGELDIFYINSLIFYTLKQAGEAKALAQMQNIANKTSSQSEIFVRSDSNITQISQLKDKTIAFVSPMGAGGYLAPRAYLYGQGVETKTEMKEVFTKNLTNSIYNVLLQKVDAATMCGVNYELMKEKLKMGELRVIASSAKYPENVLAARTDLAPQLFYKLKKIILLMRENSKGRVILEEMRSMKIQNFVPYDAKIERLTKDLLKKGQF